MPRKKPVTPAVVRANLDKIVRRFTDQCPEDIPMSDALIDMLRDELDEACDVMAAQSVKQSESMALGVPWVPERLR